MAANQRIRPIWKCLRLLVPDSCNKARFSSPTPPLVDSRPSGGFHYPSHFQPFQRQGGLPLARAKSPGPPLHYHGITTAGYIMYRHSHTSELVVRNPLTGSCLPFPSVTTLPPEVRRDIFISSTAALLSGSTITAAAIAYTSRHGIKAAAFARLGDSKWTFFGDSVSVKSMIFHKSLLDVLTTDNRILTWDPRVHPAPPLTLSTHNLASNDLDLTHYSLVESSAGGDLLQVVDNSITAWHGEPPKYKVFKLDPAGTSGPKWCMVTSLCGEDVLMLSRRGVVCISTRDFPELRQNCIYSTLYHEPECALNVFNLGEGRVVNYHPLPDEANGGCCDWFIPSLD